MQCTVYKSLRQLDYFLYVRTVDDLTRVPDGLKQLLGTLVKDMDLELRAQRTLAQADVREVIGQIEAEGYYLQMPPRPATTPLVS